MGISEPAVGWTQIMRLEAWLKPYLDPDFWKQRKPLKWTTDPQLHKNILPTINKAILTWTPSSNFFIPLPRECLQLQMEGRQGVLPGANPLDGNRREHLFAPSDAQQQSGLYSCTQYSQVQRERKNKLMSRVHNGNQMLNQQVTGKQNTGSLGRVFWQL